MRFVGTSTSNRNEVTHLQLGGAYRLPIDEADEWPQQEIYEHNKSRCYCGWCNVTGARKDAHCRRTPKCRGCIQATDA